MAARKGRNSAGHVDPFYQRRCRFEAFFRAIGLHEPFARIPRRGQEFFWKLKFPDPILQFDPSFPADDVRRYLCLAAWCIIARAAWRSTAFLRARR